MADQTPERPLVCLTCDTETRTGRSGVTSVHRASYVCVDARERCACQDGLACPVHQGGHDWDACLTCQGRGWPPGEPGPEPRCGYCGMGMDFARFSTRQTYRFCHGLCAGCYGLGYAPTSAFPNCQHCGLAFPAQEYQPCARDPQILALREFEPQVESTYDRRG